MTPEQWNRCRFDSYRGTPYQSTIIPYDLKRQREQALKDHRDALENFASDNSDAAIVQIRGDDITVMACAAKADAAEWLRARGEPEFAALVEVPAHDVFFAAVVVNDGGITVSHMRKAGR